MLRHLALILALGLSPALAEEANLSPQPETVPGAASQMVLAQRLKWGSVYRLLLALGNQDARVRLLLKDAGKRD